MKRYFSSGVEDRSKSVDPSRHSIATPLMIDRNGCSWLHDVFALLRLKVMPCSTITVYKAVVELNIVGCDNIAIKGGLRPMGKCRRKTKMAEPIGLADGETDGQALQRGADADRLLVDGAGEGVAGGRGVDGLREGAHQAELARVARLLRQLVLGFVVFRRDQLRLVVERQRLAFLFVRQLGHGAGFHPSKSSNNKNFLRNTPRSVFVFQKRWSLLNFIEKLSNLERQVWLKKTTFHGYSKIMNEIRTPRAVIFSSATIRKVNERHGFSRIQTIGFLEQHTIELRS